MNGFLAPGRFPCFKNADGSAVRADFPLAFQVKLHQVDPICQDEGKKVVTGPTSCLPFPFLSFPHARLSPFLPFLCSYDSCWYGSYADGSQASLIRMNSVTFRHDFSI
jgi:hypothetical protein